MSTLKPISERVHLHFPCLCYQPLSRKSQHLGFVVSRVQVGCQWTGICRELARYVDTVMPKRDVTGQCLIRQKFYKTTWGGGCCWDLLATRHCPGENRSQASKVLCTWRTCRWPCSSQEQWLFPTSLDVFLAPSTGKLNIEFHGTDQQKAHIHFLSSEKEGI